MVEVDWADKNHVISYIAENQQSYLALLLALQKMNLSSIFTGNKIVDITELINIAGGDKYQEHLTDLIS